MSAYTPEPTALDPRPLLPAAHGGDEHDAYDHDARVVITTGAWDADLFDCFDSWVNCCTVWWLPCISLAQISQRVGWAPYWKVLQLLLVVYVVEIFLASVVTFTVHSALHDDTAAEVQLRSLYHEHPKLLATASIVSLAFSACTFLGSFAGVVMILITWSLRGRIREMFQIPGSGIDDGLVSVCCSPCTVAQMATHVKSYKKGTCDIGPVDTLPGYGGELPRHHATPASAGKDQL